MADQKKFLDYSGVSYLWGKINEKVNAEKARAEAAEAANAAAAKAASDAADALDTKVGEIPSGYSEKTIVEYINKKAEETLDAATGSSGETAASVAKDLADYKNEVNPQLEDHESRLDVIEGKDYLIKSTKTAKEIEDAIGANSTEIARVNGVLVNAIENNAEGLDSIKELAAWIEDHGSDAAGYASAISALEEKVDTGDKKVSAYVSDAIDAKTGITGQTVKAYVDGTFATDDELGAISDKLGTIPTGKTVVTLINESKAASNTYADGLFANINALSNTEIQAAIEAANA